MARPPPSPSTTHLIVFIPLHCSTLKAALLWLFISTGNPSRTHHGADFISADNTLLTSVFLFRKTLTLSGVSGFPALMNSPTARSMIFILRLLPATKHFATEFSWAALQTKTEPLPGIGN